MDHFKAFFITIGIASLISSLFILGGKLISTNYLINPGAAAAQKSMGYILWNVRSLDVMGQGFIIFIGALGIFTLMAMMYEEQTKKPAHSSADTEVNK